MILGLGTDIVDISRIESLLEKFDQKFEEKIFTKQEILVAKKFDQNIKNKAKHYAKRFSAKEAFAKATGLGIGRGVDFLDIEISNDKNGKPEITLSKKAELFLQEYFKLEKFRIDLSLADEPPFAKATVIISKILS